MNTMKILICGDSYSTDFNHSNSWVTAIQQKYNVTNLSAAGISEYKILKQLETQLNTLSTYDLVLVFHTSPNRVHIANHPMHSNKTSHHSTDLLFTDIEFHLMQQPNNKVLQAARNYFLYVFDPEYYLDMYSLIQLRIKDHLRNIKSLHLTNFDLPNLCNYSNYIDLKKELDLRAGNINHYDDQSNIKIYRRLSHAIDTI